MTRQEAVKLIGTHVMAWTSANGCYAGELVDVIRSRRPWRGKVKITGVFNPACPFELGQTSPRRGLRPGEVIECGGVNITPLDPKIVGVTYLKALLVNLERNQALLPNAGRDRWAIEGAIKGIHEQIRLENERLEHTTTSAGKEPTIPGTTNAGQ